LDRLSAITNNNNNNKKEVNIAVLSTDFNLGHPKYETGLRASL
jgi:hypothetical protein